MPESEFAVSDMYIFTILILVLYLDYVTVGYSGQNRSVFRRGAFQMHEWAPTAKNRLNSDLTFSNSGYSSDRVGNLIHNHSRSRAALKIDRFESDPEN